jgi:hypothetical protein
MAHGFCRDILSYSRLFGKDEHMMGPRSVTPRSEIGDAVHPQGQTAAEIYAAANREDLQKQQAAKRREEARVLLNKNGYSDVAAEIERL